MHYSVSEYFPTSVYEFHFYIFLPPISYLYQPNDAWIVGTFTWKTAIELWIYEDDFNMECWILFSYIDMLLVLVVLHTFSMLCSFCWSVLPPHLPHYSPFLLPPFLSPSPPTSLSLFFFFLEGALMFTSVCKVKLNTGKESVKVFKPTTRFSIISFQICT